MSTTPIFSIIISYKDRLGFEHDVTIPLNDNQNIEVRLLQDKAYILDKKYIRHDVRYKELTWLDTKL